MTKTTPSPKVNEWTVELYVQAPEGYDHERGIDHLVWEMRQALREKTGVWFEYRTKRSKKVKP